MKRCFVSERCLFSRAEFAGFGEKSGAGHAAVSQTRNESPAFLPKAIVTVGITGLKECPDTPPVFLRSSRHDKHVQTSPTQQTDTALAKEEHRLQPLGTTEQRDRDAGDGCARNTGSISTSPCTSVCSQQLPCAPALGEIPADASRARYFAFTRR